MSENGPRIFGLLFVFGAIVVALMVMLTKEKPVDESEDQRGVVHEVESMPGTPEFLDPESSNRGDQDKATEARTLVEPSPLANEVEDRSKTYSLRGLVVFDESGQPASGAEILVSRDQPDLYPFEVFQRIRESTRTGERSEIHDLQSSEEQAFSPSLGGLNNWGKLIAVASEDGSFEISGVPDRSFFITAKLPHFMTLDAKRMQVQVDGGDPKVELRLIEVASLSGVVRDTQGAPMAGAKVTLSAKIDPMKFAGGRGSLINPGRTETDPHGRFSFDPVTLDGDLEVTAEMKGYPTTEPVRVETVKGQNTEVTLQFKAGATLDVTVRNEEGVGLKKARVSMALSEAEVKDVIRASASSQSEKTDEAGVVRFNGIGVGRYRVEVKLDGFVIVAPQIVEIGPMVERTSLDFTLSRGLLLRGKVVSVSHEPIEGAELSALQVSEGASFLGRMRPKVLSTGKTGEDGTFELSGLESGDVLLKASAKGFVTGEEGASVGGSEVILVLAECGSLSGTILSNVSGEALTVFDIELERETASGLDPTASFMNSIMEKSFTFASDDGSFTLRGVDPGSIRLIVSSDGHAKTLSEWMTLKPGESKRDIVLRLPAECAIEGKVIDDASGKPVSGVSLNVQQDIQGLLKAAVGNMFKEAASTSDNDGLFRVGGLSPGAYTLMAEHEDFAPTTLVDLMVEEGGLLEGLEVRLLKGASIYGIVTDENKKPVEGATILVSGMTGASRRTGTTDTEGQYEISGLSEGTFSVVELGRSMTVGTGDKLTMDASFTTKTVVLKKGERARVDFLGDTTETATLVGVVMQNGKPVESAFITVVSHGGGGVKTGTTGSDGTFSLKSTPAGRVLFQVQSNIGSLEGIFAAYVREFDLPAGETTRHDVTIPGGVIEGRLVDAATGKPLPGTQVYASWHGSSTLQPGAIGVSKLRAAMSTSDDKGGFRLSNLGPGTYSVVAGGSDLLGLSKGEYALTQTDGIQVSSGTTSMGSISLHQGGTIKGTVRDGAGGPVPGAGVYIRYADSSEYLQTFTSVIADPSGAYEYRGVPSGVFDVVCSGSGKALSVKSSVELSLGQTKTVNFELKSGTEVFIVYGKSSDPIPEDLTIEVLGPDGKVVSGIFSIMSLSEFILSPPESGAYPVGILGPGVYVVRGVRAGQKFERTFRLSGEKEMRINVGE